MKIKEEEGTIEIVQVENGYILKHREYIDEGNCRDVVEIFETDDTDEGDHKAFIGLLYAVAELMGISYDKFKEGNLNIDFSKKGHKL